jgi:predicted negative regulator of RcsB-dependent stress response
MKTAQRHQLKHNELSDTLQDVYAQLESNRTTFLGGLLAVVVVAAAFGAWSYYRGQQNSSASVLLAEAQTIADAQVVPPIAPAPGQTAPPQPANTYPSLRAKLETALPKYLAAANAYPGTESGIAARYHAAAVLTALGRGSEARQRYQEVIERDGRGIYGRMSKLALADADLKAGQYDPAIATLRELSQDTKGDLPVDAILMQLGQAYLAAGKKTEARQAFQRLTTEFASSPYAADARKQIDALKAGA